jgi:hypothetical protein
MLICAVATRRNWQVLSNDSGLNRCLPAARKFQQDQGKAAGGEDLKPRGAFRRNRVKT